MESHELDHGTIAGILKTIFLFLEGQNLNKTCETFLGETEKLGYPPIRTAIAQILILKPELTETVTVTRAPADVDIICHCEEENEEIDQKNIEIDRANETIVQIDVETDLNEEEIDENKAMDTIKENCFPCEDCNELTPVSDTSIPDSENRLAMTKPSVTFSSEKNSNQNPPKQDEQNQKDQHQQKDSNLNHNMLLKDRVITNGDVKETDFKSISDIIENKMFEGEIDEEDSDFIDPYNKHIHELVEENNRNSFPLRQVTSEKGENVSQKDESFQIDLIDFDEIGEKSNENGGQVDVSVGTTNPEQAPIEHIQFDYKRIKYDLKTHNYDFKLTVLQAVRWQITKTSPEDRNKTMMNLAKSDLLGLHGNLNINEGKNNESSLVKLYLLSENSPNLLQEGIARLLNAISSCTLGRDYLCQDDRTIRFSIIPLVCGRNSQTNSIGISETTKEHLLVTLQKLSLRSKMRLVMIESGLPEYLVEFLSNKHDKLSDYCLEYTCALFMNLCLHKETHFGMRNISNYLLEMLIKLLTQYEHCVPYLNGAMYSLFNDDVLRELAKKSRLYNVILDKIKLFNDANDIKQQLELIIKELDGKLTAMAGTCNIDCQVHEDVEIDYIEPEIDVDDSFDEKLNGTELRTYEKQNGQFEAYSFACLCQPVMPFKKITIKSFCTGGDDEDLMGQSLDAILTTVEEIDKEIADANKNVLVRDSLEKITQKEEKDKNDAKEVKDKNGKKEVKNKNGNDENELKDQNEIKELKDQNVFAKVDSKNKSTQNKKNNYRDRYDPSPPIIYDPIHCSCVNKRECHRQRRKENHKNKEKCNGNQTFDCNCIVQMQEFVENHCGNCGCPTICKTDKGNHHHKIIYESDY